jgi:hypothetical protein
LNLRPLCPGTGHTEVRKLCAGSCLRSQLRCGQPHCAGAHALPAAREQVRRVGGDHQDVRRSVFRCIYLAAQEHIAAEADGFQAGSKAASCTRAPSRPACVAIPRNLACPRPGSYAGLGISGVRRAGRRWRPDNEEPGSCYLTGLVRRADAFAARRSCPGRATCLSVAG